MIKKEFNDQNHKDEMTKEKKCGIKLKKMKKVLVYVLIFLLNIDADLEEKKVKKKNIMKTRN